MPTLAKILSEEEEKLQLAQVEELEPQFLEDFGNATEVDNIIFRIFAPHAHTARNQYEERKKQQNQRNKWLETIVNSQQQLLQTQNNVRQFAERAKQQAKQNQNSGNPLAGR